MDGSHHCPSSGLLLGNNGSNSYDDIPLKVLAWGTHTQYAINLHFFLDRNNSI